MSYDVYLGGRRGRCMLGRLLRSAATAGPLVFLLTAWASPAIAERPDIVWMAGGHNGVYAVAFSPDGNLLASGGLDRTTKLWRATDGLLQATLLASAYPIAFSPTGQILASGSASDENAVQLWQISNAKLLRVLTGHTGRVLSVAVSPNGQIVAAGSADKTIRLWRVVDGTSLLTLAGHAASVNCIAFSVDGYLLASGSADQTTKIWRVADGAVMETLVGHTRTVTTVAFSLDGHKLASGGADGIRLWQTSDWQLLQLLPMAANCVAFSPNSEFLVAGDGPWYGKIGVWTVSDGKLLRSVPAHNGVASVAVSPDGATVASARLPLRNLSEAMANF